MWLCGPVAYYLHWVESTLKKEEERGRLEIAERYKRRIWLWSLAYEIGGKGLVMVFGDRNREWKER
jgi:hypothetical protein